MDLAHEEPEPSSFDRHNPHHTARPPITAFGRAHGCGTWAITTEHDANECETVAGQRTEDNAKKELPWP